MDRNILLHAPNYWDKYYSDISTEIPLQKGVTEYEQVANDVRRAITNRQHLDIKCIKRIQNIHDYGQYILREQLLAVNSQRTYYRVRRYTTIKRQFLNCALNYNLDPRRCGKASLRFEKNITCGYDDIILVVTVVTANHNETYTDPTNSSDYFIDYVVEIQ